MHNIDDQDGNVTERASTRTKVSEGFVSRSVDYKKARNLVFLRTVLVQNRSFGHDSIYRKVRSTDLLGNTSSFTLLNVGLTDLMKR